MDPQLNSMLTSVGLGLAMSAAGWAVSKGIIPSADQSTLANQLVLVAGGTIAFLIGWYKKRQLSQKAMITAVNAADNGVKVVASTSTAAPAVNGPMK